MTIFKALSVSQPFAYLIASGKKTIELRSWNTGFRGEFFIHAPTKIRASDCARLHIDEKALVSGALVGKAVLYDVKTYNTRKEWQADRKYHFASAEFSNKKYGFLLKSAKALAVPVPCKGHLGFFDVQIAPNSPKEDQIASEIFDEEYRTQWINHH